MSLLGGRQRLQTKPACPAWVVRFFCDGEAPAPGTPDFAAYAEARYLAGPSGEENLWRQFEPELLAQWTLSNPGTRPWAWWRYSAPEGRQQTSGKPIERGALHDQVDEDGLPLALHYFEHGRVEFESAAAFLRRHGLFLEAEARRVKRSAFADERVTFGEGDAA